MDRSNFIEIFPTQTHIAFTFDVCKLMGSSQLILKHLLILLLLLYSQAMARSDPSIGYNPSERDALYALKTAFNESFLIKNWTGLQCYMNYPPKFYGIECVDGRVTGILLESMGLTGKINVDAFANLSELSVLSLKNNSISGNVMDFSSNQKLTRIDLSRNQLQGPISPSLLGLGKLESLQLQDNNLTGLIPEFNQPSLREFNVSNNDLSGPIPPTEVLRSFASDSYLDNPKLCGPPSPTPCSVKGEESNDVEATENNSSKMTHFATIFIAINVVGLVVIVLLFILYFKKARKLKQLMKERRENNIVQEAENIIHDEETTIEAAGKNKVVAASVGEEKRKLVFIGNEEGFELADLLKASAEGLGKGNFGNSYKAKLAHRPPIVVKRLRDLKPLSSEEFTKQLQVIADQKHPNLLPLLAYYYSNDEKLVVHKYAQNGNLFDRIHGRRGKDRIPFRWSSRLSVARGVAQALEYLHSNVNTKYSQISVPHGNLKSSNVLLDDNNMVLVSDYGLTSLISLPIAAQRMISYKSPEFQTTKKVSNKSDVWTYGCLVLELLTGRISANSAPPGINGVDLCNWVHRAVREEWTAEVFDQEICVRRSASHGMLKLLQIAIQCCEKSPEKRPEMSEVVREVENIQAVDNSEDESDDLSLDPSLTDDSLTTTASAIIGDER